MKILRNLLFLFLAFLILSCQNQSPDNTKGMGYYAADEEYIEMESPRTEQPPLPPAVAAIDRGSKLIKTGSMEFEVSDLEEAKRATDQLVDSLEGYLERERFNAYGNRKSYALTIRVPQKNFDALIEGLEKGEGRMQGKEIRVRDVTEEYVDLTIRLENNLAYLIQYQRVLESAKTVDEVLEVKEKIRAIEEEIESKKGRMKFLEDQVKYATLELELETFLVRDAKEPQLGRRIQDAFRNGVQGGVQFILMLIGAWPFVLVLLVLFIWRKSIFKRWSRKKRSTS